MKDKIMLDEAAIQERDHLDAEARKVLADTTFRAPIGSNNKGKIHHIIEYPPHTLDLGTLNVLLDSYVRKLDEFSIFSDDEIKEHDFTHFVFPVRAALRLVAQEIARRPPHRDVELEEFEVMQHHPAVECLAGGKLAAMDRAELEKAFYSIYYLAMHEKTDPSVKAGLHLVTRARSNDDLAHMQQKCGYGPHTEPKKLAMLTAALHPYQLSDVPRLMPTPVRPAGEQPVGKKAGRRAMAPG